MGVFRQEGNQSSVDLAVTNYVEAKVEDGESAEFHKNGFVKSAGLKKNGLKDGPWNFMTKKANFCVPSNTRTERN